MSYLAHGTGPSKRALIGGNWKCNGTTAQVNKMIETLNQTGAFPLDSEVVIAVPSLHLAACRDGFRKDISVAAQDVGLHGCGAYTGELSAELLVDSGIKWTLTGHSERRVGFGGPGESSATIATKTKRALGKGMKVILCIGEQLTDREAGRTMEVCMAQLQPCVDLLSADDWKNTVIAYEPVWAIGTGKVATPAQAEETHREIRDYLATAVSKQVAAAIRIIYGGSVKGANCVELMKCAYIDGFLVGGASLLPEFGSQIATCTRGNVVQPNALLEARWM